MKKIINKKSKKKKNLCKINGGSGIKSTQDFFHTAKDISGNLIFGVGDELRQKVFHEKELMIKRDRYLDMIRNRTIGIFQIPEKFINKEIILESIRDVIFHEYIKKIFDKFCGKFINEHDFIYQSIIVNHRIIDIDDISKIILSDKYYLVKLIREISNDYISKSLIRYFEKDIDIAKELINKNGLNLRFVSDVFKNNKEICKLAIQNDNNSYIYCSETIKNDPDICLYAIYNHRDNNIPFKHFPDNLRDDREICIEALKVNGYAIMYCSKRLKNDREINKMALNTNPLSLQFCNEDIKQDVSLCLKAIEKNAGALIHCHHSLNFNINFCIEALKLNSNTLDLINYQVLIHDNFLQLVNKNLSENIVIKTSLKLIRIDYNQFKNCVKELQMDIDFCVEAISINNMVFRVLPLPIIHHQELINKLRERDIKPERVYYEINKIKRENPISYNFKKNNEWEIVSSKNKKRNNK